MRGPHRPSCARKASRRSRSRSCTAIRTQNRSGKSGGSCEDYAPDLRRLALQRCRARDPRIRAHLDHDRQCLYPAGRRGIPDRLEQSLRDLGITRAALRHDLVRWAQHGRNRARASRSGWSSRDRPPARWPPPITAASPGESSLLSFDMGGTTAKACLIDDNRPSISPEFEVNRVYRFKKGSGLPVRVAGDRTDRDRRRRRQHCPGRRARVCSRSDRTARAPIPVRSATAAAARNRP